MRRFGLLHWLNVLFRGPPLKHGTLEDDGLLGPTHALHTYSPRLRLRRKIQAEIRKNLQKPGKMNIVLHFHLVHKLKTQY
jgi:hypothetical protein